MSGWVDGLLTGLLNNGPMLLFAVLFVAALGVPLPATMLVMAAGAFARQGVLNVDGAAAAALAGSVSGDACSYLLGRFGADLLPMRWRDSTAGIRATRLFDHWGGWSVFLTRFLFTPAALPVNLLAGSTRYAWPRFMAAVLAGQATWIVVFGGLGHLFADRWEAIGQAVGDLVGLLLGALLVVAGVATLVVRRLRRGSALQARHPAPGKPPGT